MLDTHIILWWLEDDPRLSVSARQMLGDDGNRLYVSIASLWEIAIKHGQDRLAVSAAVAATWLNGLGVEIVPLALPHLVAVETLPAHHRDPFDRLIVAQALVEQIGLMSYDRDVRRYPVPFVEG